MHNKSFRVILVFEVISAGEKIDNFEKMPNYKQLTEDQKSRIIALFEVGKLTVTEISKEVGCNKSTVSRLLKKNLTGTAERKKGTGGIRKTSKADDRVLHRLSLRNRFSTAVQIRTEFVESSGTEIGVHTVRRRLREFGLMARRPAKKPMLTPKMMKSRLTWANKIRKVDRN